MVMEPPVKPDHTPEKADERGDAAVSSFSTLEKRRDFLAASHARRKPMPGFLLQARKRKEDEPSETSVRVGYTCSKKVGNAVTRNRAKRRLRALAQAVIPEQGRPGWDYVLVGRSGSTVTMPFTQLVDDLHKALTRIHENRK